MSSERPESLPVVAALHLVVVGRTARPTPDFSLLDLAGTSGRADVLVRCMRSALLVSHGVRRDVTLDLVLLGGASPRTVRIEGHAARFLRPDERALATLLQKTLAMELPEHASGFVPRRHGVSLGLGGLELVRASLGPHARIVLDERGDDLARVPLVDPSEPTRPLAVFVGDHLGLDAPSLQAIDPHRRIALGRTSLHAEDAIAILHYERARALGA